MRKEQDVMVEGIAAGRIPVPGANSISEEFRRESELCVYDCGRKARPGKDCCKECLEEAMGSRRMPPSWR